MRTIIIGFSKSKKKLPIGSWIIRLYQWSEYSHIYIRIPTTKFPSDIIIHSSEGKVQRMSGTQFNKRHKVIKEYKLLISQEMYTKIINEMHEISGDDYGIMQNIGIVWVNFLQLFNIRSTNPWKSGWNCSEFVAHILNKIYPNKLNFKLNTVIPKDIYRVLNELFKNNQ